MVYISDIIASEILDSKGDPTVEVAIRLSDGTQAIASCPSGASTGVNEALFLVDHDKIRYHGKGVQKAVDNVNTLIKKALKNKDPLNQEEIDNILLSLDKSQNKSVIGGNAITPVSMAVCRASSLLKNIPLFQHLSSISGIKPADLPEPLILILEGGMHGKNSADLQEFMIMPKKETFKTFRERYKVGQTILEAVGSILLDKEYLPTLGFEGAYSPPEIKSNEEAFEILVQAIEKAGFRNYKDILITLDCAASYFYDGKQYYLKKDKQKLDKDQWYTKLTGWIKDYSVSIIEDGFSENDRENWQKFYQEYGAKKQIIGDDLTTTNVQTIKKAVEEKLINSVIIKPNQIGTVSETIQAIKIAKALGIKPVVSHRGGETFDDFVADLAFGCNCPQVKFGSMIQDERKAKYKRLLDIETQV